MPNVVVHVGYLKTATTTFQRHLFSNHPDIDYLGKTIPDMRFRGDELYQEMLRLTDEDEVRYDGGARLREIVRGYREASDRKVLLLSHENLIHPWGNDKGLIARRIHSAFGPCRIVITLRNQLEVIRSFYAMHGQYGDGVFLVASPHERVRTPMSFKRWLRLSMRAPWKNLPSVLHYYDVIHFYASLFGRENVGVFLFEEFVRDPESYVRKLSAFLGIDTEKAIALVAGKRENQRFTKFEAAYLRLARVLGLQRFDWSRETAPWWIRQLRDCFGKNEVYIRPAWADSIAELYAEGNRRLEEEFDLPLEEYGYPNGTIPRFEPPVSESANPIQWLRIARKQLSGPFEPDPPFGWRAAVPEFRGLSDNLVKCYRSHLELYEDGVRLRPAHSTHECVRTIGRGRFSHWAECVLFSTSDNSDPNTNGRTYTCQIPNAPIVPRLGRFLWRIPRAAARRLARAG
jgi:hypothetical protein